MKRKYGVEDGDADMLVIKELLSSLSANSGGAPSSASGSASGGTSGGEGTIAGAVMHDAQYLSRNLRDGIPGLKREVDDTMWNIENIQKRGPASSLMRGVLFIGFVYLLIGSAYKYQTQGSRGIDMIPHIGFWSEYPRLVADGV